MCGIAGVVHLGRGRCRLTAGELRAMSLAMQYRGPDDDGELYWSADQGVSPSPGRDAWQVGFVHRRLSIIDLSSAGHQPMARRNGTLQITYNGEIYNYLELRSELEGQGCRFTSNTDTEVLLAAYEVWGEGMLGRLVGMFAFAILDTERRIVLLARDFFGIKPLFWAKSDDALVFASELPALLCSGLVKPRADPQSVFRYLRFGIAEPVSETMLAGICRVPPGHLMVIDLDRGQVSAPRQFWDVTAEATDLSFEAASDRLAELIEDSVRIHLRSDVSVGVCLSGGIDSSTLVANMRRVGGPDLPIHTVSFVARNSSVDEERWVDVVNRHAGAIVHKVVIEPGDVLRDMDEFIGAQGEPFGTTSAYAQYRVFKEASAQGIKVMLDGQGADELFAGYYSYVAPRLVSMLRGRELRGAWRLLRQASERPGADGVARTVLRTVEAALPGGSLPLARRLVGEPAVPSWLNTTWFADHDVALVAPPDQARVRTLHAALRERRLLRLPGLLRFDDRNSMTFSIESRVPFLTPELANFAASLPEDYLLSADRPHKAVLRASQRGRVPDEVLDRQDKIGFTTPESSWMSAELIPWVRATLRSPVAARIPALDAAEVQTAADRFIDGHAPYGRYLWRAVNLIKWSEGLGVEYDQ